MKNNRLSDLDFLRIFACLLVITSHIVFFYALNPNYPQWKIANIMYIARNACVPLFFAISGILLLGKNEFSVPYIVKKIIMYGAIYVIGCTFWQLWGQWKVNHSLITLKMILEAVIPGMRNPSLMWYFAALCGIFPFVPILTKIAKDKKLCEYYLLMWVAYNFLLRNFPVWLGYLAGVPGKWGGGSVTTRFLQCSGVLYIFRLSCPRLLPICALQHTH